MVGRTLLLSLLAIPLFLFKVLRPGRDTQVTSPIKPNLSSAWYYYVSRIGLLTHLPFVLVCSPVLPALCLDYGLDLDLGLGLDHVHDAFWCWSLFSTFVFSSVLLWTCFSEWIIPWLYAAVSTLISFQRSFCPFHRRHGHWRCLKFFPAAWLALSSPSVNAFQVSSFTTNGFHRLTHFSFPSFNHARTLALQAFP